MSIITKNDQFKQQLDVLKNMAKIATDSKQYASMSESSLLNLMLSANDLGISPMKAINGGFYIVNGKVCMSTSLMVDRIRRAGHSIQIKAMTKEKCIILATRKDNGDSLSYEYTWEDATLAGLTNSPTWKKYPKQMLYNRCMSNVARILFSDVVGNCYSEEERFDIQNVPAEQRPLEDPESAEVIEAQPVQIEISTDDEKITESQAAQIDFFLLEDKKAVEKICKVYEIESVYELKQKDFQRVLGILEQRKQAILEKKNVKSA